MLERLAPLRMKQLLLRPKVPGSTVPLEVILNRSHRHLNQGGLVRKGPCFQVHLSLGLGVIHSNSSCRAIKMLSKDKEIYYILHIIQVLTVKVFNF